MSEFDVNNFDAIRRTPVLIYKYRSLICLYHMIIIQKVIPK